MITVDTVTEFLAWSSIINIGLLLFSALFIIFFPSFIVKIHSKLFDLDGNSLPSIYFQYLAQYKILVIIFNIVPYFALKIIGG